MPPDPFTAIGLVGSVISFVKDGYKNTMHIVQSVKGSGQVIEMVEKMVEELKTLEQFLE